MMSVESRKSRNPEIAALTGLRFVAALSVALSHTLVVSKLGYHYWPVQLLQTTSAIGMTLFFVLSGFVMHYNYFEDIVHNGWRAVSRFFFARFARLYPLYLLVLLASFFSTALVTRGFHYALVAPYYLTLTQSWFYTIVGTHSLPYAFGYMADLTWSISTEWFFYFCLPLLCVGFYWLRSSRATLLATGLLVVLELGTLTFLIAHRDALDNRATAFYGPMASHATSFQDSFYRWLLYFSPYLRIGEFILGGLISHLHCTLGPTRPSRRASVNANVAATLAIAAIVFLHTRMFPPVPPLPSPIYPPFIQNYHLCFGYAVPSAVLLFCLARYDTLWSRLLSTRLFLAGGAASYSIYLLHLPLLLLFPMPGPPDLTHMSARIIMIGRMGFALAFIVLVSYGVYQVYEYPMRRLLRGGFARVAAHGGPSWTSWIGARGVLVMLTVPPLIVFCASIIVPAFAGNSIRLITATYGANCGAPVGNASVAVERSCELRQSCIFAVRVDEIGDPAPGCAKDFDARWRCGTTQSPRSTHLAGETGFGSKVALSCRNPSP